MVHTTMDRRTRLRDLRATGPDQCGAKDRDGRRATAHITDDTQRATGYQTAPNLAGIDERLRSAGLPGLESSSWIEVDVDALERNARVVRQLLAPGTALGIVVKANAYGHGLELSARAAIAGGGDWLIVATLDEARRLRRAGLEVPILLIYPLPPSALRTAADLRVDVTVGDRTSIAAMIRAASGSIGPGRAALRVHLEVDTGMTRGGVGAADAAPAAHQLAATPGIALRDVWSHLAKADDAGATWRQIEQFDAVIARMERAGILIGLRHIAASESVFRRRCPSYDMVRIGDAFYGGNDLVRGAVGSDLIAAAGDLRPALALKARAVRLAEVARGTEVGYGAMWRADRASVIATLVLGYGDGWPRAASLGAHALVRGRRVPVVGRVSMDALTVDVTDAGPVTGSDEFVLIGHQAGLEISAADVAATRGTITRESLATLGPRLPRVYLRGIRPVAIATAAGETIVAATRSEDARRDSECRWVDTRRSRQSRSPRSGAFQPARTRPFSP